MKGGKQNLKLKGGENIREHKKYPNEIQIVPDTQILFKQGIYKI